MDWLAVGGRRAFCCPCRPVPSVCLIVSSPPLPCFVSLAIDFVPVGPPPHPRSPVPYPLSHIIHPPRLSARPHLYAGRDGMGMDYSISMS